MPEQSFSIKKEYKLFDLLELLNKWKKVIVVFLLSGFSLGIILAIFVTREYKSVARILSPKETNPLTSLGGLSTLAKSFPSNLSKLTKSDEPNDYIAIIKSRSVLEDVIKIFNLTKVYDISDSSMEKTIKVLVANLEVDWTEESVLEIRVWDVNAVRSSNIANYFFFLLNRRSFELQTQEGRNNRVFIEERLNQTRIDLAKAEQALQEYQEKKGMIIPMDISSPGLSSFAEIYASKVKKEIEAKTLLATVGTNHAEYRQAILELGVIEKELGKMPQLSIGSLRLFRDLLIQQKILELLVPLCEQAKISENKDVPVAYLLDPAKPGERPDRPKRIFIVGISTFVGLILAVFTILLKEYLQRLSLESPENYSRMRTTIRSLFSFK